MRELNLIPVQTRRFKATTNSKHSLPVAPNLLQKDFAASAPCQKWVGDITYVYTREAVSYTHLAYSCQLSPATLRMSTVPETLM